MIRKIRDAQHAQQCKYDNMEESSFQLLDSHVLIIVFRCLHVLLTILYFYGYAVLSIRVTLFTF